MQTCPRCGKRLESDAVFCSKCGTRLEAGSPAPGPDARPVRPAGTKRVGRRLLLLMPINIAIVAGALFFVAKGCDKAEGTLVAAGKPLGDFTLTARHCRSGARMGFFGVVVLGEGPNDGAVVVIEDPVKGKLVKVEVPGSCKPPDLVECTELLLPTDQCSVFKATVRNTNTSVNDVVLREGRLDLECTFQDGGTASAHISYEGCG